MSAQPFFVSGAGNGINHCFTRLTSAEMTAIETANEAGSKSVIGIRRFKELTFVEIVRFFWFLKAVGFDDALLDGVVDPVEFRIDSNEDGSYLDMEYLLPYKRICWDLSSQTGLSETTQIIDDYGRFYIHGFYYNTTDDSYHLYYSAVIVADDGVHFKKELEWESLTFEFE